MATDLCELILNQINEKGTVDSLHLVPILKVDHQRIIGAVKSIQALGNIITGTFFALPVYIITLKPDRLSKCI